MIPKVFISIIDFHGREDTVACLKSLSRMELLDSLEEVVVVNNYSLQKLVLPDFKHLKVRIIESGRNLGFSGGQNVGINYALRKDADYVLVLNNDTLVEKNLLAQLINGAKKHPEGGIFAPKIYFAPGYEFHKDRYARNEQGHVLWSAGGSIDWKNVYGKNRGVDEVDRGQFDRKKQIDFATGAAMFIRREVFEEIGFFDEDYFMYMEDVDFCVRAAKKGWKIFYLPDAVLWHRVAQSSGIGSGLNDYYLTRNRLMFSMNYASFRTKIALLRESLLLLTGGRKWQKIGVLDFYKGKYGKGSFPVDQRDV